MVNLVKKNISNENVNMNNEGERSESDFRIDDLPIFTEDNIELGELKTFHWSWSTLDMRDNKTCFRHH